MTTSTLSLNFISLWICTTLNTPLQFIYCTFYSIFTTENTFWLICAAVYKMLMTITLLEKFTPLSSCIWLCWCLSCCLSEIYLFISANFNILTLIWWSFTVLYRVFNLFRFLVKHVINILSVNIQIFNFWWFLSLLNHSLDHDLYSSLPDIDWHYNYYFQRKDFL